MAEPSTMPFGDLSAIFFRELRAQLDTAAREIPLPAASTARGERCRELARVFHTIKGSAGVAGRSDLAAAAGVLERFFSDPGAATPPTQEAIDVLFAAAALRAPVLAGTPGFDLSAAQESGGRRPAAGAVESMPGRRAPVLVVDDSPFVRDTIASLLGAAGIPSATAADGRDALGRLAGTPVAAVITDLDMPHMDGLALIRALRADPRWRGMPVLLCTARQPGPPPEALRDLQVARIIGKPFDHGLLLAEVCRLLDGPAGNPCSR